MGLMTYVLTQLFLQRRYQELSLPKGDATQARKQAKKIELYLEHRAYDDDPEQDLDTLDLDEELEEEFDEVKWYDAYRAFYAQLSKITRQVWRFLKNCFSEKHALPLYERQLKPLLQRYL